MSMGRFFYIFGRAQRARTSELNGNFVCMYVCINRPRSVRMRPRATRKRSRPCLFRSLRSPTNALHSPSYLYVCLYVINRPRSVRMRPRATRKRSRPCLFRSLRSPTNALHSPSLYVTGTAHTVMLYLLLILRAHSALANNV